MKTKQRQAVATVSYTSVTGRKHKWSFGCVLPADGRRDIRKHAERWLPKGSTINSISIEQMRKTKPKRAKTVSVKAWGIFQQGFDAPLDVHSALFCDQASVEKFAEIQFPGWKNLRVQEITITYKELSRAKE